MFSSAPQVCWLRLAATNLTAACHISGLLRSWKSSGNVLHTTIAAGAQAPGVIMEECDEDEEEDDDKEDEQANAGATAKIYQRGRETTGCIAKRTGKQEQRQRAPLPAPHVCPPLIFLLSPRLYSIGLKINKY